MLPASASSDSALACLTRGERLTMGDAAYSARLLRAEEARAAFALISLEHPDVTLELWRAFVRRANRGPRHRRGLVAITDRRGTIHAVFAYQVADDLRSPSALHVSDVVMGRLPGGTLPRATLACIERLAGELGSSRVRIDFLEEALAPQDREVLLEAGFRSAGVNFSRLVPETLQPPAA
jgi:hypothetical protein